MLDISTLSMTEIIRLQNRLHEELTRRFERSIALVFADIVGSSPYFVRFGDGAGRQLQQLHFDLLTSAMASTGGRMVDTAGDGAFLTFPSASAAVTGVIEFLRQAARANQSRGHQHQLQVRIGVHWGAVLIEGNEVAGDAVNLCSRVAASAEPGDVRLTRAVFQELDREQRLNCRPLGHVMVKGFEQAVEMMVLDWRDPMRFPRGVLVEETNEHIDLPQQDIVSFGRLLNHAGSRANDVVLNHPDPNVLRQISRWHFELRRFEHGLMLMALSDGTTTVDGVSIQRGAMTNVHAGTRIGLSGVLNLRLIGAERSKLDPDDSSTMIMVKGHRAGSLDPSSTAAS